MWSQQTNKMQKLNSDFPHVFTLDCSGQLKQHKIFSVRNFRLFMIYSNKRQSFYQIIPGLYLRTANSSNSIMRLLLKV